MPMVGFAGLSSRGSGHSWLNQHIKIWAATSVCKNKKCLSKTEKNPWKSVFYIHVTEKV